MYNPQQLSEMEIGNFEAGYRRFIDTIVKQGFIIKNVLPINNNRYCIVLGEEKAIMFMYKREVFRNFGIKFRSKGYSGVGDSINCEDLKKALRNNVQEIYTCFPNGIVYKIKLIDFLEKSMKWTNKEGKEVRSISVHAYLKAFEL